MEIIYVIVVVIAGLIVIAIGTVVAVVMTRRTITVTPSSPPTSPPGPTATPGDSVISLSPLNFVVNATSNADLFAAPYSVRFVYRRQQTGAVIVNDQVFPMNNALQISTEPVVIPGAYRSLANIPPHGNTQMVILNDTLFVTATLRILGSVDEASVLVLASNGAGGWVMNQEPLGFEPASLINFGRAMTSGHQRLFVSALSPSATVQGTTRGTVLSYFQPQPGQPWEQSINSIVPDTDIAGFGLGIASFFEDRRLLITGGNKLYEYELNGIANIRTSYYTLRSVVPLLAGSPQASLVVSRDGLRCAMSGQKAVYVMRRAHIDDTFYPVQALIPPPWLNSAWGWGIRSLTGSPDLGLLGIQAGKPDLFDTNLLAVFRFDPDTHQYHVTADISDPWIDPQVLAYGPDFGLNTYLEIISGTTSELVVGVGAVGPTMKLMIAT